ncbi:MFS transporter [Alicyclobacillus fastidiosus]|uniref:MFS transporter n=1 Tax=Alicyclobacillus fastidiosus TaxID=392011 RepID=A0ABV5A9R9_9BACL|nr:MFS transporter [Alicyclobacillus fastidiosus]WEH10935.1 MFS transporter [Alicyclobacillus fastidiosus]
MDKSVPSRRWLRIIPVALLMYTIAYIDKSNVSFAFSGMEKDLGFGATASGLVSGILFFGYLFTQMAGGYMASRSSPKKIVFWLLIIWGLFAMLTGLAHNLTELLIARFMLGLAEGGVFPSTIVLFSRWFPSHERARATGYWILCQSLGSIVMAPLSGWILYLLNWRWLFFIEGAMPWVWAIVWWIFISDDPRQANWISEEERNYIVTALEAEQNSIPRGKTNYLEALRDKRVWILLVYLLFEQIGYYGVSMWLPTIVKSFSHQGSVGVGYLTALPWIAAMIGIIINSNHSDRTGERIKHASYPLMIGAIFLVASVLIGASHPVWSLVCTILAVGVMNSYNGVVWAIPASIFASNNLGGTVGFINGIANLGGFFGPFIVGFLIQSTGHFLYGTIFNAVCLIVAGLVILPLANPGFKSGKGNYVNHAVRSK